MGHQAPPHLPALHGGAVVGDGDLGEAHLLDHLRPRAGVGKAQGGSLGLEQGRKGEKGEDGRAHGTPPGLILGHRRGPGPPAWGRPPLPGAEGPSPGAGFGGRAPQPRDRSHPGLTPESARSPTQGEAVESLLAAPETQPLWKYFLELSRIPRGSKNEAAAAQWVADQGKALGCEVERDAVGNVILRKKASPGREGRPTTCLQAHVDMVCEKNEGTPHDFLKDPIQVRRDGDLLRATGTTLGADNGIGVCSALAVLASKDIAHGPLEVLITIDEETGLTGANGLVGGLLKSKYLLNLDSEEEGFLTIGCAGGVDTIVTRPLSLAAPPAGSRAYRLKVFGLKGGHSGIDIHAGRGNAIRLLAQVLFDLRPQFSFEVAAFKGGNKRNAIPREASATIALDPAKEGALRAALAAQQAHWKAALGAFDPGLELALEPAEAGKVMSGADADAAIRLLLALPHGVEAMSPDIKGLVQTSTNLGVIGTEGGRLEINLLTRSSIDASKKALTERIAATCALGGFQAELSGGYPGWKPEPRASLVQIVQDANQQVFGKPLEIMAIHAGLECGLIGEKYPDMEMVSFGPSMWDVHTPDEHVSIPSVGNFWKLLVAVLERV
ncbi:MAG: beta-Ala-His dipeptidase [Acidobacteria bacterium]|nr:beta-Ala-His dipeptidase [Acidobacteriota bacterium]